MHTEQARVRPQLGGWAGDPSSGSVCCLQIHTLGCCKIEEILYRKPCDPGLFSSYQCPFYITVLSDKCLQYCCCNLYLVSPRSFDIIHTTNYRHWRTVIDQSCAQYSPMWQTLYAHSWNALDGAPLTLTDTRIAPGNFNNLVSNYYAKKANSSCAYK